MVNFLQFYFETKREKNVNEDDSLLNPSIDSPTISFSTTHIHLYKQLNSKIFDKNKSNEINYLSKIHHHKPPNTNSCISYIVEWWHRHTYVLYSVIDCAVVHICKPCALFLREHIKYKYEIIYIKISQIKNQMDGFSIFGKM